MEGHRESRRISQMVTKDRKVSRRIRQRGAEGVVGYRGAKRISHRFVEDHTVDFGGSHSVGALITTSLRKCKK